MKTPTFETGVSDHHKLIGTVLRSTFAKGKPKKMFYRCYRNFDNKKFEKELQKQLASVFKFLSCQSESTLYSCLNVKELLARSRCEI